MVKDGRRPKLHLNMWQRLGIIGSVLWALGAGVWQNMVDSDRAYAISIPQYESCSHIAFSKGQSFDHCMAASVATYQVMMEVIGGTLRCQQSALC